MRRFAISGIRFEADVIMPNQDGVHVGGFCEYGLIQDITATGMATPNDDLVALNADDANHRAQNLGKRRGPIRHVHVRQLRAEDCHSFVRFLSVDSPIEDVVVEDVRGGCRVCAINADACRSCMVPVMDASDPRYVDGCGDIRDCRAIDMKVHKSIAANAKPLFDLQSHARVLEIRDVMRDGEADMCPKAPTVKVTYVPGSDVILEGITRKQLADACGAMPTSVHCRMRLAQLTDTAAFRVEAKLSDMEDALVLPGGGFSRLELSR